MAELIEFIYKGGFVFYMLVILSIILWSIIFQKYFYLFFVEKNERQKFIQEVESFDTTKHWLKSKVREELVSVYSVEVSSNIKILKTIVILAPMLGLLGTVMGMIEMFDVMGQTGSIDAKTMAKGISLATLATLAGLLIAIIGLIFSRDIENRIASRINQFKEVLYA